MEPLPCRVGGPRAARPPLAAGALTGSWAEAGLGVWGAAAHFHRAAEVTAAGHTAELQARPRSGG